jgi:hypothetical protein
LTEYLITKTGQAPQEYIKYQLRLMYHCPPSVLAEQTGDFLFEALQDLACQRYEVKAQRLRRTLG